LLLLRLLLYKLLLLLGVHGLLLLLGQPEIKQSGLPLADNNYIGTLALLCFFLDFSSTNFSCYLVSSAFFCFSGNLK
jgi:hypothetical protein